MENLTAEKSVFGTEQIGFTLKETISNQNAFVKINSYSGKDWLEYFGDDDGHDLDEKYISIIVEITDPNIEMFGEIEMNFKATDLIQMVGNDVFDINMKPTSSNLNTQFFLTREDDEIWIEIRWDDKKQKYMFSQSDVEQLKNYVSTL